jgi:hypothetical protein
MVMARWREKDSEGKEQPRRIMGSSTFSKADMVASRLKV